MVSSELAFYVALMVGLFPTLRGHGYLKVPPGRSTLWTEFDSNTRPDGIEVNYNHMGLNCGGQSHQWGTCNGVCGICGDPCDGVRENEAGGKYASGFISRHYQLGEVIDVEVQITADHKGWFEFRLCPHNNPDVPASQDCLDQYLLAQEDGSTRYTWNTSLPALHSLKLKLPDDVTCSQCIIQWKYHTGNSWGCDSPNDCGLGLGPQEEFYGCSDISIAASVSTSSDVSVTSTEPAESPTGSTTGSTASNTPSTSSSTGFSSTSSTADSPTRSSTDIASSSQIPDQTTTSHSKSTDINHSTQSTSLTSTPSTQSTNTPSTQTTSTPSTQNTITPSTQSTSTPSTQSASTPSTSLTNTPSTPQSSQSSQSTRLSTSRQHTTATSGVRVCVAVSPYDTVPGMKNWCETNCGLGNCPSSHCKCTSSGNHGNTKISTLTKLLFSTTRVDTSATSGPTPTTAVPCKFYKSRENLGAAADSYCNVCGRVGSCPDGLCTYDTSVSPVSCTGQGSYSGAQNIEDFCTYVCSYSPSDCPQGMCLCTS